MKKGDGQQREVIKPVRQALRHCNHRDIPGKHQQHRTNGCDTDGEGDGNANKNQNKESAKQRQCNIAIHECSLFCMFDVFQAVTDKTQCVKHHHDAGERQDQIHVAHGDLHRG